MHYSHRLSPSNRRNARLVVESRTVVPQPTAAASAPRRPSRAGARALDMTVVVVPMTVKFGGGSPPK